MCIRDRSTLEIGTLYGNTDIQNGSGNFILYDANKAETINFYFGSQQESISFLRSGNNLFRGSFTFSNKSIQPKFRIPKDISYSKDFAKINLRKLITILNNVTYDAEIKFLDWKGERIAW